MEILYTLGSMFKNIIFGCIFLLISANAVNSEPTAGDDFLESVGVITANVVYVREKPDLESKRIYTFYEGSKIILVDELKDWYKVKVNNIRTGYALKKDIEFNVTLGKETKRGEYFDQKLALDIRSFIDRFNFNMKESGYFEREGIVPAFEYKKMEIQDSSVALEIIYTINRKSDSVFPEDNSNPFSNELKYFLEVLFFKLINSPYETFQVDVFSKDDTKDKKTEIYATFAFDKSKLNFNNIKDSRGKIWNYVTSSKNISKLFSTYPIIKGSK